MVLRLVLCTCASWQHAWIIVQTPPRTQHAKVFTKRCITCCAGGGEQATAATHQVSRSTRCFLLLAISCPLWKCRNGLSSIIPPSCNMRCPQEAWAAAGVDVVLDTVGGAGFEQALKSVRWGAHVLIIGFASGDVPKVPANIALVKNLTVSV